MLIRRRIVFGCLFATIAISIWFFPLFHIRSIGASAGGSGQSSTFNSNQNASSHKIEDLATQATDLTLFWDTYDRDSAIAKKQFGQQSGLGSAYYFCLRGRGTVESIKKDCIILAIENTKRRVCIDLGVVVDNTVRDALGVKASEFANSQEFNALSSELNRQVEQSVIEPNRERFSVGAQFEFAGCGKVAGRSDLDPLRLIPIEISFAQASN